MIQRVLGVSLIIEFDECVNGPVAFVLDLAAEDFSVFAEDVLDVSRCHVFVEVANVQLFPHHFLLKPIIDAALSFVYMCIYK